MTKSIIPSVIANGSEAIQRTSSLMEYAFCKAFDVSAGLLRRCAPRNDEEGPNAPMAFLPGAIAALLRSWQ
jgi:hypothetical protein